MVSMHNSCLMLQSSNSVVFSVYTTLSDNAIQQKAKLINVNMESVSKIEDLEFTGTEWDHVCIFIGNGQHPLLLSVVYSMITRAVKNVIIYTENATVCNVIDAYHSHVGDKLVLQIRSGDFPEITDDIKQHLIDDTKLVSSLLEVLFLKGDSEKPQVFNLIQYIIHQHRDHAYNSSSVWLPAFFRTPKCRHFLKRCKKLPILAKVIKQTDLQDLDFLLSFCCHKPTLMFICDDTLESYKRQTFLRDNCDYLFLKSCFNECEDTVQYLLEQNSSLAIYIRYTEGATPLVIAAQVGNLRIAGMILDFTPDEERSSYIEQVNDNGQSAFFIAAVYGHLKLLQYFRKLHKSKAASQRELHTIVANDGETPLLQAVMGHRLDIVSWLLSIDPDCIKTRSKRKVSVLHCAAENGNIEIASVLLKSLNSSDKLSLISLPDNNGYTAFHFSCSNGHLEFSKWLLEEYKNCMSESDPLLHTIQDNNGYTPLMYAVGNHLLEIVSWLVSIDPNCIKTRNKIMKESLLHCAAENGNIEIASVLLKSLNSSDKSSLISLPDNNGCTVFHFSCSNGQLEFSKWLLEEYKNCMSESDPLLHTIQDNNGYTPLMYAGGNHQLEIVSWLVSIDPNCIKTRNKMKESVLHCAAENGNIEIASVLLKSLNSSDKSSLISSPENLGRTVFHFSCSKGHLEFSKWLLEEYKNCMSVSDPLLHTIQDNNGSTPLMYAGLNHHLEIVSWLVSIDPNCIKTRNKMKVSVLHCDAENGNIEIASVLLKSLNSSDKSSLISSPENLGRTVFHISCSKGHLEFSKWLLEEYKNCMSISDPLLHTIQDINGDTPLMYAGWNHHLDIVSWLLSIDPDCIKTRNKMKVSVLHCAAENGNIEIASVLLKSLNSSDKSSLIVSPENLGRTAFHFSCSKGHFEFCQWLIHDYENCKTESDPPLHTIQNNDGCTPLIPAVVNHHLEIVSWLVSIDPNCIKTRNKFKVSVLHCAAENGNIEIASVLLKSLNSSDKSSLIVSPENLGRTAFHFSCSKGHFEFCQWLIHGYENCKTESDPPLHTIQDINGDTPLMYAVSKHHLEIVSWLASIDPNCIKIRNKLTVSVLHCAAKNGNIEIASVLLKSLNSSDKSSLISSPDNNGVTAFHFSCSEGHLEFCQWLIRDYENCKSESDPPLHTIQHNDGNTPLMPAVVNHHLEIVSWLVSIDPNCIKTRNKFKVSVLHCAAEKGNIEIASVLLKSLNSSDKSSLIVSPENLGRTAFHFSCSKGHFEFCQWLIHNYENCKTESDPPLHTIQNNDGCTPLMPAVVNHHLEIVSWLVSIDPNCIKTRNKFKVSVLHCAAENGNIEIASVLLKSLNSSDKSSLIVSPENLGRTAFHFSCSKGHFEFCQWLIHGYENCKTESDPPLHTIQDINGDTPLMYAVSKHHLEIVSWLASIDPNCIKIRNKLTVSVLHCAAKNGNIEIASVLLKSLNSSDKSSLISSPDNNGVTAFHFSCSKGHLEFCQWLIHDYENCKSESDPLLHTIQDNDGFTPLVLAVANQHLEIVSWLVSIDPKCIKTQNKLKRSVLHCAAENGNIEIASVLLKSLNSSDRSSLISSPENLGWTAFHFSCSKGHLEFCQWLIHNYENCKSESDPPLHTIQDNDGNTPLMLAVSNHHLEIVSWLSALIRIV